jgi:hypothetical protein
LVICTGDANLTPDIGLIVTPNVRDHNARYSTGRATYGQPVLLWDAATGEMASFNTTFDFQINLYTSTYPGPGDGIAFFLGHVGSGIPVDRSGNVDSGGGSLGLLHAFTNGTGNGTIVAVEFDTFQNPQNADISSSHVGIDINSINSTASTDTTSPTRNLTSGYKMTATVTYENVTRFLAVELNINGTSYYVNTTVDLRRYLPEYVTVGFSASTGDPGERHQILSWSFASTLEVPAPAPPPHLTPDNIQHAKKRVVLLTSVLAPLLFLLACAALLAFLVWQKRNRRRRRSGKIPC